MKVDGETRVEEDVKIFTELILEAGKDAAPLTSSTPKRTWWNEECQDARAEMKKAFRRMRRDPTAEALQKYKSKKELF